MIDQATTDSSPCWGCGEPNWRVRAAFALAVIGLLALGATWALRSGESVAASADRPATSGTCAIFDHSHAAWSAILARYVRNGRVDYAGLKNTGESDLQAYLGSLETGCRGQYRYWTREQRLAFWINAYNAYAIRLILDHYPVASIRSIGLLPGTAFRTAFISMPGIRDGTLSLNDIEHQILRKEFSEPRIHFAIVCASKGCPVLRAEAYAASALDRQLDDAARIFVRDQARNRFDAATRTLAVSPIFKWFNEDFERAAGSMSSFVERYADEATAAAIRSGVDRVEYLAYDWSLNGV